MSDNTKYIDRISKEFMSASCIMNVPELIQKVISDTKESCKKEIHENWQDMAGNLKNTPYAVRCKELIDETEIKEL